MFGLNLQHNDLDVFHLFALSFFLCHCRMQPPAARSFHLRCCCWFFFFHVPIFFSVIFCAYYLCVHTAWLGGGGCAGECVVQSTCLHALGHQGDCLFGKWKYVSHVDALFIRSTHRLFFSNSRLAATFIFQLPFNMRAHFYISIVLFCACVFYFLFFIALLLFSSLCFGTVSGIPTAHRCAIGFSFRVCTDVTLYRYMRYAICDVHCACKIFHLLDNAISHRGIVVSWSSWVADETAIDCEQTRSFTSFAPRETIYTKYMWVRCPVMAVFLVGDNGHDGYNGNGDENNNQEE